MASLILCTGVLLNVWPWCFDQRAWCMGAAVSSNLPGVSTNARADDTIPRPFWNARAATMLTVAKLISRLSLHLALANIHHAKLSFCSRDPSTFEAPLIPASLGTWELNLIPSCLVWWGSARICYELLGIARICWGAMLGVARIEIEFGSYFEPNLASFCTWVSANRRVVRASARSCSNANTHLAGSNAFNGSNSEMTSATVENPKSNFANTPLWGCLPQCLLTCMVGSQTTSMSVPVRNDRRARHLG